MMRDDLFTLTNMASHPFAPWWTAFKLANAWIWQIL